MSGSQQLLLAAVQQAVATDPNFEYTTLLLPGNGTNGAQNNTFLDSSTNAFSITRNGNTTQGTFSPFSQTGWGNYFDGTANGSLRADSSADTDLSADFTIQAWVFPTANGQASNSEIISRGAASTSNGWRFLFPSGTTQPCFSVNYSGLGNTSNSIQSSTNVPLNQWSHIAVTRSGNTAKIYINGSLDTTNTGFATAPTVSGTEYVYVGRGSYDTSNRQYTGYINNASIIKGTALTTFNTTTPLSTSTSGQSLLTCTSNRFIDTNTATTAKTLTAGSGVSVQAFSPFNPTAAWSAATYGGSGYFDGSGDYLTAPDNAAFDLGAGAFTLECFAYLNARAGAYDTLIAQWNNSSDSWLLLLSGNTIQFYGNGALAKSESVTITTGQWYHFACTRDSSNNLRLYANGVKLGSDTAYSTTLINSTASPSIGCRGDGLSTTNFNGYLSSVRVIKGSAEYTGSTYTVPTAPLTAITNTSLLCNFTNAGIYDATSKNDLETVGNAQISTTQSKFGGSSMYFDGTGDYLVPPASQNFALGSGNFTVEVWIKTTSAADDGILQISTTAGGFATSYTSGLMLAVVSGTLYYALGGASSSTSTTINDGNWHHLAIARSGSTLQVFVDGTSVVSTTNTNSVTGTNLVVGGYYSSSYTIDGYLQDLRITKGIARYTAAFTPPTAAFPLF